MGYQSFGTVHQFTNLHLQGIGTNFILAVLMFKTIFLLLVLGKSESVWSVAAC
jgi:uncharacterized protein YqhQ